MPLQGFDSLCPPRQPKIISHDKGSRCMHIALNDKPSFVTHYHIDGIVIADGPRCDFLLMNEDTRLAYLIELKGRRINKAIDQLEATAQALKPQLADYSLRYRIVASRSRTQEINSSKFLKFKKEHKNVLKNNIWEEHI